ncbi:aminoglycoside phosphotransferase family protein [Patescibacteria group bacterium]
MRDNFMMGSPYEGMEGMFQDIPESEKMDVDVEAVREEKGIYPDAQERFDNELQERGWEQVHDIAEGIEYPSLDDWVEFRLEHRRGAKFFPCFVKDGEGEVSFIKFQISDNQEHLRSLEQEAAVLAEIRDKLPDVNCPKFHEFQAQEEGGLAFLKLDAIDPSEGRVALVDEWTGEQAADLARQLHLLENFDLDSLSDRVKTLPAFEREETVNDGLRHYADEAEGYLDDKTLQAVRDIASRLQSKEVMVHGDACLKNLIANADQTATIVDWELAAKDFIGRDAGKFMTKIERSKNPEVKDAFMEAYVNPDGQFDAERSEGMYVGMLMENIYQYTHLIEKVIDKGRQKEYPDTPERMEEYKQNINRILEKLG